MSGDLTFFTNEPDETLLDRFKATLAYVKCFDILVGYFRTSGFQLLYESFETIEKIRILVGLNVDRRTFEIVEAYPSQLEFDFESHQQIKSTFADALVQEMEDASDTLSTELGVKKFIEWLQRGKLEIKAHPSQNLHAKVYISRFPEGHYDYGRVITGSSNFSHSGLVGQYEFNVELKNSADVKYALAKFEDLWQDAVDLSEAYVETIYKRTWLNDQIPPYYLYLKFLYEYFKEDISLDDNFYAYLPEGFLELKYQKQAVVSAKKILESYQGVFLADVVGLGKTFISALLAQQLPGKKLIICPPVLQEYWEKTFFQFGIGGVVVESLGKLDHIIATNPDKFDYVFVDEAHRFRNEVTQGYEKLHRICWGKKVVLVSATPLNNTIADIYSQLKLFQAPKQSTIPGVPNLEKFFSSRLKQLKSVDKNTPEYVETVKAVSKEVRDTVLKHVMVRRTRTEIVNYFNDDISKQGLTFPDLADPQRIIYEFDPVTDQIFNQTIELLQYFTYARYTPLLYLKKSVSEFEAQSQRNVGGFMKGLLVKRLESSFFAFKRSLARFIESYQHFIAMYQQGTVYISKAVNVYDLLDADDEEQLLRLVEADKVQKYHAADFTPDFLVNLKQDLQLLEQVQVLWANVDHDPKLAQFIAELQQNKLLKHKKVIIFTESSETGQYLHHELSQHFAGQVLFYCSHGAAYGQQGLSKPLARDLIEENYNPNSLNKQDDLRLLITTDVLAEGTNLHRSNIVINYDLPWNPTRVLQRVGRVNRVGTEHNLIYIFNFFPTAQSDQHLGLENNIKAKIQAFHDMLGEDAKYLTEEEDVSTFELFGDRLYKKLTSKESFTGEEEEMRSELEYLRLIQQIRDDNPTVFEKIKRLPKKARSSRRLMDQNLSELAPTTDHLLTFFRKGQLKKFFLTNGAETKELTFLEAVDLLQCDPATPRQAIPPAYYDFLTQNKAAFDQITSPALLESGQSGGQSNEKYIIKRLKAKDLKFFKGFTDDDEAYLNVILQAFEAGIMPKNTSKRLKTELETELNPLKVLAILKKNIPAALIAAPQFTQRTTTGEQGEVILSEYFV
ncbi:MAG: helicase [Chloroflexi bacterium]|nr:helicase [Chloroflexota bacterium]